MLPELLVELPEVEEAELPEPAEVEDVALLEALVVEELAEPSEPVVDMGLVVKLLAPEPLADPGVLLEQPRLHDAHSTPSSPNARVDLRTMECLVNRAGERR